MNTSPPPIASPNGTEAFPSTLRPDEKSMRLPIQLLVASLWRYLILECATPLSLVFLCGPSSLLALVATAFWVPTVFPAQGLLSGPLQFLFGFVLIFGALVLAILLAGLSFGLPIRLCSKRRFEIWISEAGVFKRYSKRNIFFPWRKFVWIIERNGDLWLASLIDGCFIPRESFASREESHELATILRELKRTRGAAWRPEWNGRVFGVQPSSEETGGLSIPR